MGFFDVPKEIRFQIYSVLLVHSEPIVLVADYNNPPSLRSRRIYGLCPALLQLNKQAHSEASPLLYSHNRFQFPNIFNSPDSASIAPFLLQVRSQANLIRHICVPFPNFDVDFQYTSANLHKAYVEDLELIRNICTSITTLELSVYSDRVNDALRDSPVAEQALDLLDTRLKAIQSLREIIVNFQVYSDEDLSDDRMKMRDRGWTIEITKLLPKI